MATARAPVVEAVVRQHADDVASLWNIRRVATASSSYSLRHLARLDQRLRANLDGLVLAGPAGAAICRAAVPPADASGMFAGTTLAMRLEDAEHVEQLLAIAETLPETQAGVVSGLGWTSASALRGIVKECLAHGSAFRRYVGLATCSAHRVDPGLLSGRFLDDSDPHVAARAYRVIGELGSKELLPRCAALGPEAAEETQFWASWTSVLLGDRREGLRRLTEQGLSPGPHRDKSFRLALQAADDGAVHGLLQELARRPASRRWLIYGSGIGGNPSYVPWLVQQMADLATARLAGDAFALIAGVDLGLAGLDCPAPKDVTFGPTDAPDDPNVEMDPEEGLSWPDQKKVVAWWDANAGRFEPGRRYFMGAPVTRQHCVDVLKNGYQRQRILAAHYLCLLEPGTTLFNTSAPAWRQQARLDGM